MSGFRTARRGLTLLSLAGFLCLLLLVTWLLLWSAATLKIDRLLHDRWVRMSQREAPSDIVIAGIDPESLSTLGRWPWPRDIQALMFEQLKVLGAKAVVADLIYTEPSFVQEDDQKLIDSIAALPLSFLPVLTETHSGQIGTEKLPLPLLSRAATDLGHINLPIDGDGIVRRYHLKAGFPNPHWSALPLAAFEGIEPIAETVLADLPGRRVNQDLTDRQWTADHEVHIPFYGPRETFATVSVAEIINGQIDNALLKDKVVFVGMLSRGLNDVVPSAVSELGQSISGVEIHANIYAALRDGSLITAIDLRWNILFAAMLLPLMVLAYSRVRAEWVLLFALGGALLPILASFLLYHFGRLWYAPLSSSVPILISYLLWSWNRLDFINRFLEQETLNYSVGTTDTDFTGNALLVDFFENASKHLPIKGWKFDARGETFAGGMALPVRSDVEWTDQWKLTDGVYRKRYPTPGRLSIALVVNSPYVANEITHYVDSLARVQSRVEPTRLSGSIERLQSNALKLGEQMEWLRSFKKSSETILSGNSAGFLVWNAAGELVNSNERVHRWFPQLGSDSLLCEFIDFLDQGEHDDIDEDRLARLILNAERWQQTLSIGEQEFVVGFDTVGSQLSDRLVCASVIDVSDIRSAERARSEMLEYLSHDLRSPLISSLYLLEDLESSEVLQHTSDPSTEKVRLNIKRSLKMMDDLLHVAKADGLSADDFEEILLNDVLDNALDQIIPQARSRDITCVVEATDLELWMKGDAGLLERAIVNILGNAVKYSDVEGEIVVKLEVSEDNQLCTLTVADDGVGIDPNIIGDIFTRFKRDARVAAQFKGIGLGLTLVSRVVQQHAGTVEAFSTGKGTSIVVKLPITMVESHLGGKAASGGRSIH